MFSGYKWRELTEPVRESDEVVFVAAHCTRHVHQEIQVDRVVLSETKRQRKSIHLVCDCIKK